MLTDLLRMDKHLRLLPRAVKVEQRAAIWIRIGNLELCPIPTRPLIVTNIRIHCITPVKTMRQRHF